MADLKHFPVIDPDDTVAEAAETIAVNKARGVIVKRGGHFSIVDWRGVAEALRGPRAGPVGDVPSIPIAAPVASGKGAHIDIDGLPKVLRDALVAATLYHCRTCVYLDERPKPNCNYTPCGITTS